MAPRRMKIMVASRMLRGTPRGTRKEVIPRSNKYKNTALKTLAAVLILVSGSTWGNTGMVSLEVCKNGFWMLRETRVETRGWELNLTSSSVLLLTGQFRTSFMPASGSGSAGGVEPV